MTSSDFKIPREKVSLGAIEETKTGYHIDKQQTKHIVTLILTFPLV